MGTRTETRRVPVERRGDCAQRAEPRMRSKTYYYRNGQAHNRLGEVGDELHGFFRVWHYNGQLAEEQRYRRGLMHGLCRHWDERGKLLGSFQMLRGTGTQRYWHDNGVPRMEIESREGRFHGRVRMWLRDGTLILESFHIDNRQVSRAAYLTAARGHPDWPQYTGELAGSVARDGVVLERKQQALLVQSILANSHAEARQWLDGDAGAAGRSLARFRTPEAARRFVELLYRAGSPSVVLASVYGDKKGKLYADWIVVGLPKAPAPRAALRNICQELCFKRRGALLPEKDIGENHLFLRLA